MRVATAATTRTCSVHLLRFAHGTSVVDYRCTAGKDSASSPACPRKRHDVNFETSRSGITAACSRKRTHRKGCSHHVSGTALAYIRPGVRRVVCMRASGREQFLDTVFHSRHTENGDGFHLLSLMKEDRHGRNDTPEMRDGRRALRNRRTTTDHPGFGAGWTLRIDHACGVVPCRLVERVSACLSLIPLVLSVYVGRADHPLSVSHRTKGMISVRCSASKSSPHSAERSSADSTPMML